MWHLISSKLYDIGGPIFDQIVEIETKKALSSSSTTRARRNLEDQIFASQSAEQKSTDPVGPENEVQPEPDLTTPPNIPKSTKIFPKTATLALTYDKEARKKDCIKLTKQHFHHAISYLYKLYIFGDQNSSAKKLLYLKEMIQQIQIAVLENLEFAQNFSLTELEYLKLVKYKISRINFKIGFPEFYNFVNFNDIAQVFDQEIYDFDIDSSNYFENLIALKKKEFELESFLLMNSSFYLTGKESKLKEELRPRMDSFYRKYGWVWPLSSQNLKTVYDYEKNDLYVPLGYLLEELKVGI